MMQRRRSATKKISKRTYFAYPLTQASNDAIGMAFENIGGTETNHTERMVPGHGKQKVYILDNEAVFQRLLTSVFRKQTVIFYSYYYGGPGYLYREVDPKNKDRKVKTSLRKTRLTVSP